MYGEPQPRSSHFSLATVVIIAVLVVAGIVANIYTYQLFSRSVRSLDNKFASLQTQIHALEDALGNYSQIVVGNISLSELYDSIKDSVVLIRGQTTQGGVAGTGFVYNYTFSNRVVIVTNYHVVQGTTSISATFMNGSGYSARVLGSDVYADLAILSVDDAPLGMFKPLVVVPSSTLRVGDLAIAVGNPYELVGSMTVGIVSQLGRSVPEDLAGGYSIADVIQISTPLNPGNSGGPLLNDKGQVVGVTFAIIANSTGVGFAIPSDTVLREISWLVDGDTYPHSWLGVSGTDMTYELAQQGSTSTTWGWLIASVSANGPAARAGLREGDNILALNETQIIRGDEISSYLEKYTSPGQTVRVTVERAGSQMVFPVVLGTRPQPS